MYVTIYKMNKICLNQKLGQILEKPCVHYKGHSLEQKFMKPPQNVNSHKSKSSSKMGHRVHTDLEKSWKMTLVLENSWNSKKVQFDLELSWNFENNLLDNHKKSLKMVETIFWMQCKTKIKRKLKSVIENKVRCRMPWYSILFYSSTCSMNQMQPEVKPCKAEIWKGTNESSMRRQ